MPTDTNELTESHSRVLVGGRSLAAPPLREFPTEYSCVDQGEFDNVQELQVDFVYEMQFFDRGFGLENVLAFNRPALEYTLLNNVAEQIGIQFPTCAMTEGQVDIDQFCLTKSGLCASSVILELSSNDIDIPKRK